MRESCRKETLMESETRANPREQRKPLLDQGQPGGLEVVRAVQQSVIFYSRDIYFRDKLLD